MEQAEAGRSQPEIIYGELTLADSDAVFALYEEVVATAPYGFLAERTEAEIREILTAGHLTASVGAWSDGDLIAYALSRPDPPTKEIEAGSPLIALLRRRGETVMGICGYAVSPREAGHRIGFQLIERRKQVARSKGLDHFLATGAVQNLSSFNAALKSGAWFVGIAEDRYCENFVTYSGPLTDHLETAGCKLVPVTDMVALKRHLADGWIGTGISDYKDGRIGQVTLRHCPAIA